jgi:hypothetical protein
MKQLIFSESCFDDNQYFDHNCDSIIELYKYEKTKTFNQLRSDIYIDCYCNDFFNHDDCIKGYMKERQKLKTKNKQFHIFFRNNKIQLDKLIENYTLCKFNNVPKQFKIKINNAKFIVYDGNTIYLLVSSDDNYYLFHYNGS